MATNLQFIKSASGSGVSSLSVTDCFSAEYDVYQATIDIDNCTSGGNWSFLRFIDSGGSVISASEYDYASLSLFSYASFGEEKGTSQTEISRIQFVKNTGKGGNTLLNIFNPNDSSSYTFTQHQSSSSESSPNQMFASKVIGVHKSAEQITGFSIGLSLTINNIEINVYGVK